MVRKERLELSRREALEPKSSVSTNSTTPALHDVVTTVATMIVKCFVNNPVVKLRILNTLFNK